MATYDPPDSHWAADFDARLLETFAFLRDRIYADEAAYAASLKEIAALKDELAQLVADAKYWAQRAEGAVK